MSTTLKPWYAVATPHEDIREDRLDEAVFAANVWAVVQGVGKEVYRDPEEFFRKTYLTSGLATTLSHVARALSGGKDAGDRIISLQTSFGGGKTHTLVALWHLARNADKIRSSPACESVRRAVGELPAGIKNVAVFTNRTCDATQGRLTPEGIHTRTLWGEIAIQLGGLELYEKVRANDEAQRTTQGLFAEVLRAAAPCLILLDELADYCVGAAAVPVGDSTLADQTISFIQELTEAVQEVPGTVVVATLPASKLEVAQSEKGQEAFITLEKRFYRLGADVKPVADEEIYEVVRTRLFESITRPDDPDAPRRVAAAYQAMYAEHEREVPSEVCKAAYREDIERAYPFHPALLDVLYKRWGSHPDFQRTRGLLRLLASIVGDLWRRRNATTVSQPLIQPCHVQWNLDPLAAALTRLWGQAYQSVAAADVLGEKSNAGVFDEERGGDYRSELIGRGIASAILLGSFGGEGERSGFSAKDVKVACSRPGLNWSYTDGALLELEQRCFYLHTAPAGNLGKRYWFGTKPTLNKLVVQYRQRVSGESFDEEILETLHERSRSLRPREATWRPVVDPNADLPEQKGLTLLLLPPALAYNHDPASQKVVQDRVLEISQRCGGRDRHYRNTLVFLAPSSRGVTKLRQVYREREALRGVRRDYSEQLAEDQREDLGKRLADAERLVLEALGPAYVVALRVHRQEVEVATLTDARSNFEDHLEYLWTVLVGEDHEWILRRVGGVTLTKAGLVPKDGAIRVKDAVEAFLRFTDKPLVASKEAVINGLVQACEDGLIGIAYGPTATTAYARYTRKSISIDLTEEGVWIIPPFTEEAKPATPTGEGTATPPRTTPSVGDGEAPTWPSDPLEGGAPPSTPSIHRVRIEGAVPLDSYGDLFRCFVSPAARMNLKHLKLGIHFELEAHDNAPLDPNDPALKAMREAARQLGLTLEVEE